MSKNKFGKSVDVANAYARYRFDHPINKGMYFEWKILKTYQVKQMAWNDADKKVDEILKHYKQGTYIFDECKTKLLKVDYIELVDIDETNVDEVILSQTRKE